MSKLFVHSSDREGAKIIGISSLTMQREDILTLELACCAGKWERKYCCNVGKKKCCMVHGEVIHDHTFVRSKMQNEIKREEGKRKKKKNNK